MTTRYGAGISQQLSKFTWLEGKKYIDARDSGDTLMYVLGVESGCLDYVHVTPHYPGVESDDDAPRRSWSMYAPHAAALVLLYDLYLASDVLLTNIIEAEEHIHDTQGHVYSDVAKLWQRLDNVENWWKGKEVEKGRDQYSNPVPDDLVCIPNLAQSREMEDCGLYPEVIEKHCDWYEVRGIGLLLIPKHQVPEEMEAFCSPLDGVSFETGPLQVDYVAESLHRYNFDDGYYHV